MPVVLPDPPARADGRRPGRRSSQERRRDRSAAPSRVSARRPRRRRSVSRVTGIAGDPLTYYAATAAGGVWKSSNGGLDWTPIFDDQPVSSIGSIAVAPSDPNVVYVGSGEANIRGNVGEGNGIYKSTDAGKSWAHVWKQEGQIGTMIVHPSDPDVAFAAVLGSPFGANPERGVYRTTDGGASWRQVLAKDADTGASDVTFDPQNPRHLLAGLWQARRYPWGMTSGGPGGGLYVSHDSGESWTRLEAKGLPEGVWGKVGVRFAPSDPRRVYALIEAEDGGLFRSDDGGETWELANPSRGLRQRAWYYTTLTVDPADAETVWFPTVPMLKTIDGGRSVRSVRTAGWDHHDVWIDPLDPKRMIVGSDAGVTLSRDGGESWHRPPLPIAQLYHVSTDNHRPYRVLASLQDWGTASGPSNSLHWGGIPLGAWHSVGGGEAGHVVAEPDDPTSSGPASISASSRATTARSGARRTSASTPTTARSRRGRTALPLPVDGADRRLAARSQDDLPRRQRPLPHPRRRSELAADQPRPQPRRRVETAMVGRADHR
ncbi:MAG: hypothetical protein HC897_06285 [Thermoanaerobaculia bacterium]|nr:hypothetical protein [Thermoanaerobaculia bacterium]